MPMTKEQAQAAKDRLIAEKYNGDEEAYLADKRKWASLGGQKSKTGGFGQGELGRRRASVAGRKGGRRSPKKAND